MSGAEVARGNCTFSAVRLESLFRVTDRRYDVQTFDAAGQETGWDTQKS